MLIFSKRKDMFADRLRNLRRSKQLTQTELGKMINVSNGTIAMWETAKRQPDLDTLIKISNLFDVSVDNLLDNEKTDKKKGVKIPVLGRIPAGIPIEAVQEILDYEEISDEMARNGEYFALKVKGNSMTPEITDGEIAIVRKQEDVNSGDICVVLVNGNEATLKRIKKSEQGLALIPTNTIEFTPTFYTYEEIEKLPVRIIGKVVETRKTW